MYCSLLMDIVEIALKLNRCEEIKALLGSSQTFSNIQEFQALLNFKLEKEQFRHEELKRQQELKVKEESEQK